MDDARHAQHRREGPRARPRASLIDIVYLYRRERALCDPGTAGAHERRLRFLDFTTGRPAGLSIDEIISPESISNRPGPARAHRATGAASALRSSAPRAGRRVSLAAHRYTHVDYYHVPAMGCLDARRSYTPWPLHANKRFSITLTPGFVKQHGKRSRSAAHQCTDGDMLAQVLLRAPLQMRVVGKMTPDTDKATCCRDTSQKGIVMQVTNGSEGSADGTSVAVSSFAFGCSSPTTLRGSAGLTDPPMWITR